MGDDRVTAEFACARCGVRSMRLSHLGGPSVKVEYGTAAGSLSVANVLALLPAMYGRDAGALHALDRQFVPFYCPRCRACYCSEHWRLWEVSDPKARHIEETIGACPEGHERHIAN